MDSLRSTMNHHVKGKHLSFEERVIIQLRLKDGWSLRAIARELNCSPSTISYEVKRGTVKLYHGKVKRYKASQGHDVYQAHRKNCGRKSDKELQRQYSEHWNDIFKTITTDNGSEFADLSNLEDISNTLVYYAHPYTSCDKGNIANHSLQDIIDIETWCNSLPRKILACHTLDEIFERELDLIYQVA
ncbi:helix-turn-helix domain-containing protein [Lactobacillus taiwanensis]|uniref:helix-turn-helix domain-containing protein n=1 Tax=Lactobacillus taiwanensis TaxID=508451 RepID=UPI00214AEBED|nr:helix-turn-helix domain-containing protein [Lactobacillus taiwanensis]MCR1915993.1 helix-turn-helix domain-containing protein [Lactobacillus taiwanensis]